MTYKIDKIEGIAPPFAERLHVEGVHNGDDLLTRCDTEEGRRQLAAHAGLSTEELETWMHQTDLMRVSGIGSESGKLLESSGVQSVTELRDRKPENVANLLHRVNTDKKLTRALPGDGGLPKREFAGDSQLAAGVRGNQLAAGVRGNQLAAGVRGNQHGARALRARA